MLSGLALLVALLASPGSSLNVSADQTAAEPFIAVMPFVNRGGGENGRYLALGFRQDLRTALSSIPGLRVRSGAFAAAYRGRAKSPAEIPAERRTRYVLEGELQQGRDRVRLDVRLHDAVHGGVLFDETFDRSFNLRELYAIRAAVSRSVARSLGLGLDEELERLIGTPPTMNLDAYRAALTARQLSQDGGPDAFSRGQALAREAITLDPTYADAHLALGLALEKGAASGDVSWEIANAEITASVDRALALDPGNGEAWSALGRLRARQGEPGADEAFLNALRTNPFSERTLYAYSRLLLREGRGDEALPLSLRANELDPASVEGLLATAEIHDTLGAYDEARAVYARIRGIDPSNPLGYALAARSYLPEGRLDEALRWLSRAQEVDPSDIELGGWMVFLNDCLEDFDASGYWAEWLGRRITGQPLPMAMKARHHYLTGNFQMALQYANLALRLDLEDRWNSDSIFMRIKRDEALAYGDPDAGIAVFSERHPGLFESEPRITPDNILQATDLALLLQLAGRGEETRRLLNAVIQAYGKPGFTDGSMRAWLAPARAQALAILGDRKGALEELRRIIDGGWRVYWRWETDLNANFNAIRDDVEFRAMVSELEADMGRQRARGQSVITGNGFSGPGPDSLKGMGDG